MKKLKKRYLDMRVESRDGFTFLELVISISIIAILTSIAIPNFGAMINRSNARKFQNDMLVIHIGTRSTHNPDDELNVDKIMQQTKIINVKVQDSLEAGFYTVSKNPQSGELNISYLERRGVPHYLDTEGLDNTFKDLSDKEIAPDIETMDPVDYSTFFESFGKKITGLTKAGQEYYMGSLVIPAEINGTVIEEIGEFAFEFENLSSVKFTDSIRIIGKGAFRNNNLTSIVFGKGLTNIKDEAFYRNSLTNVALQGNITTIGNAVFMDNNIKNITIPDGVVSIGERAFYGNNTTDIALPFSLSIIGSEAFSRNTGWKNITDSKSSGPWSGTWMLSSNADSETLWLLK